MDELVQMDWERCVAFHGHVCPGLAIGFQAAQIALKVLRPLEGESYNPKSGIVSIVQNDACGGMLCRLYFQVRLAKEI